MVKKVHVKEWILPLANNVNKAEAIPPDCKARLLQFQSYMIDLHRSLQMLFRHTGNADQTPNFLDMPMSRTVSETSAPPSSHKDYRRREHAAKRDAGLLGGQAQIGTIHHFPVQNHAEGVVHQECDRPLPRERFDGHSAYA